MASLVEPNWPRQRRAAPPKLSVANDLSPANDACDRTSSQLKWIQTYAERRSPIA